MLSQTLNLLVQGTFETLYMVAISGLLAVLGGWPLGIILFITRPNGLQPHSIYYKMLNTLVNIIRAIPFIILLVLLVPFTRLLIGTAIGINAAIVPLTICAIPFMARIVESALLEVHTGLIEAGHAMGANTRQIVWKILLPESLPATLKGLTLTLINLIGYSAMAGAVGGGGLGSVAINYGYLRFDPVIMLTTVIILIFLVYLIQFIGDRIVIKIDHR